MRVFVTGATGFVGSAVVQELLAHGHAVTGLARSDDSAAQLETAGAAVLRGAIQDLDILRRGADQADGVIHCAFNHDFSKFAQNSEDDRAAIETMGSVLEGSTRPLLATSGLAMLAQGRPATEADRLPSPSDHFPRQSEAATLRVAERGVRASVVRLPPTTHGKGDHGFVPTLVRIARETGKAAFVGDGENRWAAGHRLDAARLYRLALEHGAEGGPFHAVAEEGIPMKRIAALIGEQLGLPVASLSPEEAQAHFGIFAMFVGMDMQGSSERTRGLLGWEPSHPDLLTDMVENGYFDA